MSGIGFSELIILALIGLIVLGPERLPRVASQLGNWIGQARRMTRVMRRQLEDELDFHEDLSIHPNAKTEQPRDDDSFSPAHQEGSRSASDDDDSPDNVVTKEDDDLQEVIAGKDA